MVKYLWVISHIFFIILRKKHFFRVTIFTHRDTYSKWRHSSVLQSTVGRVGALWRAWIAFKEMHIMSVSSNENAYIAKIYHSFDCGNWVFIFFVTMDHWTWSLNSTAMKITEICLWEAPFNFLGIRPYDTERISLGLKTNKLKGVHGAAGVLYLWPFGTWHARTQCNARTPACLHNTVLQSYVHCSNSSLY